MEVVGFIPKKFPEFISIAVNLRKFSGTGWPLNFSLIRIVHDRLIFAFSI